MTLVVRLSHPDRDVPVRRDLVDARGQPFGRVPRQIRCSVRRQRMRRDGCVLAPPESSEAPASDRVLSRHAGPRLGTGRLLSRADDAGVTFDRSPGPTAALVRPGWLFEVTNLFQRSASVGTVPEVELAADLAPKSDLEARILTLLRQRASSAAGNHPASADGSDPNGRRTGPSAEEALRKAKLTLEQEYSRHWTVDRLGRHVGCNRTDLESLFRKHVGYSVHAYLVICRVRGAQKLLRNTAWRVEAIAEAVGYRSKSSLHTNFRRTTGMTPDEYRSSWLPRPPSEPLLRLMQGN